MPDPRGPKVGRLSDLVRKHLYISVSCENRACMHSAQLEPADLIERLGDIPLERLNQRLVCSKCHRREIHLQAPPKDVPFSPGYEPR